MSESFPLPTEPEGVIPSLAKIILEHGHSDLPHSDGSSAVRFVLGHHVFASSEVVNREYTFSISCEIEPDETPRISFWLHICRRSRA